MRPALFALPLVLLASCVAHRHAYQPAASSSPQVAAWRLAHMDHAHRAAADFFRASERLHHALLEATYRTQPDAAAIASLRRLADEAQVRWDEVLLHHGEQGALDIPDQAHPSRLSLAAQIGTGPVRLEPVLALLERSSRPTQEELRAEHLLFDDDAPTTGLPLIRALLAVRPEPAETAAWFADQDAGSSRRKLLRNLTLTLVDDAQRLARECSPYFEKNQRAIQRALPEPIFTGLAVHGFSLALADAGRHAGARTLWLRSSPGGKAQGLRPLLESAQAPEALLAQVEAALAAPSPLAPAEAEKLHQALCLALQADPEARSLPSIRSLSDWPEENSPRKRDRVFGVEKDRPEYKDEPEEAKRHVDEKL